MRQTKIPQKQNRQESMSSNTDLRYMDVDDYSDYPSAQNLPEIQSQQVLGNKIIKKKSRVQNSKSIANSNLITKKSSQQQSIKSSKISNRRISQFKDMKSAQFQLIWRTFGKYSQNSYLTYNELIMALKSMGIEIDTQKRFQMIKNVYDQGCTSQKGVEIQFFVKLSLKLLKQQKSKPDSTLGIIQKGFYYMVQQGNSLKIEAEQDSEQNSQEYFAECKKQIQCYPQDLKTVNAKTLENLVQYLGMQKQISKSDIEMMIKYTDNEQKGFLTYEDIVRALSTNETIRM